MPPKKRNPPPRVPRPQKFDRPARGRSNRLPLLVGSAVLLLALSGAALGLIVSRDNEESIESAMNDAGCSFSTVADQGQGHVDSYDAEVDYNSFPPTSGTHHQIPVIWGAYSEPVPTVAEVHNLEHGGVIIHYGDKVDPATRDELRRFYDDSPNAMLLSPLPKLGDRVSFTAWTKLATCKRFDENAAGRFRSAFRGNGPERFRVGDLVPGT
jgi:hypothetical protein